MENDFTCGITDAITFLNRSYCEQLNFSFIFFRLISVDNKNKIRIFSRNLI